MKIIANNTIYVDGKEYNELSEGDKKNLWLRCLDYMHTHYDDAACILVAATVPCCFGEWKEDAGHSIDI